MEIAEKKLLGTFLNADITFKMFKPLYLVKNEPIIVRFTLLKLKKHQNFP